MYGLKSGSVGVSRAELGGKVHKSGNCLENNPTRDRGFVSGQKRCFKSKYTMNFSISAIIAWTGLSFDPDLS